MASTSSLYPEQLLKRRAMSWAVRLKVNPQIVQIEELPTKWGSCSTDGIVTFADDLATADEEFQDFVIVHELLHLRYPTHGGRFKAMMSALIPNWRELEKTTEHATKRGGDKVQHASMEPPSKD